MLGRDHRLGDRQIAERGAVQMDEIDLRLAGQRDQLRAQRRQLALAARQPVERGLEQLQPQPGDRFGLGALGRRGLRPGHRQHRPRSAMRRKAGRQLEAVLPHAADAVGDQQDTTRRGGRRGHGHRQTRSSSASGSGRSSWMSLNASKA